MKRRGVGPSGPITNLSITTRSIKAGTMPPAAATLFRRGSRGLSTTAHVVAGQLIRNCWENKRSVCSGSNIWIVPISAPAIARFDSCNENLAGSVAMTKIDASERIDYSRRRLFGVAALSAAVAQLGLIRAGQAQTKSSGLPAIKPGTNSSFGPLKQLNAGLLNVGYAEVGPADGPAVILLHGWPYDIHSYVDVTPLLASAGYRVIAPYLRGYGTTRFLSSETFRNGQQSAVALDVIDLMDALKIEKAVVAGFDWGARTADIIAALWPERCKAIVSVSGYLIGTPESNKKPLPPKAELEWWYHFYFATERGREGYAEYRHDFAKLIWQTASPKWGFDDATFNRSAASLDNPDHVAIVMHNYRWRIGLAKGESRYDDLEKRLAESPVITVPAIA